MANQKNFYLGQRSLENLNDIISQGHVATSSQKLGCGQLAHSWTTQAQQAFYNLKKARVSTLVPPCRIFPLVPPCRIFPFVMDCDALRI